MTAAEEIEAAIGKLEALKAGSTQGESNGDDTDGWFLDTDGSGRYGVFVWREESFSSLPVALHYERSDVALIVTLHRTIDAQLAILRSARDDLAPFAGMVLHDEAVVLELSLARAINGAA